MVPYLAKREQESWRWVGWGERGCCLPARCVISSCCGYCKWTEAGIWELAVKVMTLRRAEYLQLNHKPANVWGIPGWQNISPGKKAAFRYFDITAQHTVLLLARWKQGPVSIITFSHFQLNSHAVVITVALKLKGSGVKSSSQLGAFPCGVTFWVIQPPPAKKLAH